MLRSECAFEILRYLGGNMVETYTEKEVQKLADAFLEVRKRYLLTQIRMSEMMGVSRRTVQMIESGLVWPNMSTRGKFRALRAELVASFPEVA